MNVLITSAGRRVFYVEMFRRALSSCGGGMVFTGDADFTSPALLVADKSFILPLIERKDYVQKVLKIAKKSRVELIIPLLDQEILLFAKQQSLFKKNNIHVMVSDPRAIQIANDKLATSSFFENIKISTPRTFSIKNTKIESIISELGFPILIKPRYGQRSQGVVICNNKDEMIFYAEHFDSEIIAQQILTGSEITIDVLCNDGKILSLVPRKRLKIRSGEVERAVTIDDREIRQHVIKIIKNLRPFGAINIQCFVTSTGPIFTEINTRFGGGYPLSDKAGAQFPELLLQMIKNKNPRPILGQYIKGLLMSRYDEAIYKKISQIEKMSN